MNDGLFQKGTEKEKTAALEEQGALEVNICGF